MPKAYWIVRVSVRDEQGYPEYLAAAGAAFKKFDANFIVRGGAFTTMEGSARERNVVIEFKDRATAVACSTALPVSTRPRQASDDRSPVDIACGVSSIAVRLQHRH